MQKSFMRGGLLAVLGALVLLSSGCSDDDGNDDTSSSYVAPIEDSTGGGGDTPSDNAAVVGTWTGQTGVGTSAITMVFHADGTVTASDAFGTGTGTYQINGSALTGTIVLDYGLTLAINATVTGSTMNGTFQSSGVGNGSGTFTATQQI